MVKSSRARARDYWLDVTPRFCVAWPECGALFLGNGRVFSEDGLWAEGERESTGGNRICKPGGCAFSPRPSECSGREASCAGYREALHVVLSCPGKLPRFCGMALAVISSSLAVPGKADMLRHFGRTRGSAAPAGSTFPSEIASSIFRPSCSGIPLTISGSRYPKCVAIAHRSARPGSCVLVPHGGGGISWHGGCFPSFEWWSNEFSECVPDPATTIPIRADARGRPGESSNQRRR